MKRCFVHLLLLTSIAVLVPSTCRAESAASALISALSCESSTPPAKLAELIHHLGGHTLISETPLTDVEYTLPTPIGVFGQPITLISIHPGSNTDGDFTEYRSLFTGPAADVARYAGIVSDHGTYKRPAGNNDLSLRFEPAGSYIVCAQGVRSIRKWIRREYRNLSTNLASRAAASNNQDKEP